MDYPARQKQLWRELERAGLDYLLITHLPNIRYLCGFTGSAGVLLMAAGSGVFFSDGRYQEQVRREVVGVRATISRKPPLIAAGEWLTDRGRKSKLKVIGVEGEYLSAAARVGLSRHLGRGFRVRLAQPLVEGMRLVKDADEIERLRAASRTGAALFKVALKAIRPGTQETEVAAEMEYAARRAGGEGMSFPTIIASGPRSAMPHARASAAAIPARGFVVCDFGVILAGYCSDMTRTVHVGSPTTASRQMYAAVRQAQQAAIETVRPGVSVGEVDQVARKILKQNKLNRYFTHSTGHGVGLEIHEGPRLAAGQRQMLQPGMVVTVEPGVYRSGSGGVRIEDMVVVTARGCEVLAPVDKELITI